MDVEELMGEEQCELVKDLITDARSLIASGSSPALSGVEQKAQ
jgi:hypothetical protein